MNPDFLKKEAERRLKPPKAFWDWCYSQIPTYKWSNKEQTIIASPLKLGYCHEKRLTKASRLTFYGGSYFFSIILVTSKRIEIQSYHFSSSVEKGKQHIDYRLTNLERFENSKHTKIGRDYRGQYLPYLVENYYSGGYYTRNKFYPNDWRERIARISELKYISFINLYWWEIERFYKYRFEIEFSQKINAVELARSIMYPNYIRSGCIQQKAVDMRTLNRQWLQKNKQFFKNSTRSFLEFELDRRIKERNGKLVPGIEEYLSFRDVKNIPTGIGINKFQNWVIKHKIDFREYLDYLHMLYEMGIEPEGDSMIVPKDFTAMHRHTVELYNQFQEEQRRLVREESARKKREQDKKLEAEFKEKLSFDRIVAGYSFHIPSRVAELIYEGKRLHHCVSSYTERHFSGKTLIVFVRHESSPNIPLYTLEVKSGRIIQFRGKYNEVAPKEVWDIAKEWMKQVKLKEDYA